ncbi:MAG: LemA family protein [Bacillota bacterium]
MIFLAVAILVLLLAVILYNSLVILRQRVKNSWAQVDVQLRRRYDLIPNLVETVKGYAAHEKEVFRQVTEARAKATSAQGVAEKAEAENLLTGALRSLFAVAENYPQLRANENFLALQQELSQTESKIAFSRQFYNDTVMNYNTRIQLFPVNLIAGPFGFKPEPYFEAGGAEAREPVKVRF